MRATRLGVSIAALLFGILDVSTSLAQSNVLVIVRTGDLAPGAGTARFKEFLSVHVSDATNPPTFAFLARLAGDGVTPANDGGVWAGQPGQLSLLVREGGAASGFPSGSRLDSFQGFGDIAMNSFGKVAFKGSVISGGSSSSSSAQQGLWIASPASVTLVAKTGDPAPNTSAAAFNYFSEVRLNAHDEVAFQAGLIGTTTPSQVTAADNLGIWVGTPGNLAMYSRKTPNAVVGARTLRGIEQYAGMRFNDRGDLAFQYTTPAVSSQTIPSGGVQVSFETGVGRVQRASAPGFETIAVTGGTARGSLKFVSLRSFVGLNNVGDLTFSSTETFSTAATSSAIYLLPQGSSPSNRLVVAAQGQTTSNLSGSTLGAVAGTDINDAGLMAFVAGLAPVGSSTASSHAILAGPRSNLVLVATTGAPAPGAPGTWFYDFQFANINAHSEVVFGAGLYSPFQTLDANSDEGLWIYRQGNTSIVARKGELYSLGGVVRKMVSFQHLKFTDASQSVVLARFDDDSEGVLLVTP